MQRPNTLAPAEAIRLLRIKVARDPGDLDAAIMLGSALYQSGDPAGSAAALEPVVRQSPRHYQALLLLARAEASTDNISGALRTLARAQQADPANTQAWQVAAALAADIRNWTELLRIGHDWTRVQPDASDAWQALSRAHFEESRFREAIHAFERVLELDGKNVSHLIGAARLHIAAQDYEGARGLLDAAQAIAPGSPDLHYTLGRLHHMTGELEAAESSYRRAIAGRPDLATAYVELGTLRAGSLEDREIQAVSQLFNNPSVHPEYRAMLGFTLGDALDRRGESGQAFAAWEMANRINQNISEQEHIVYQPQEVEGEPDILAGIFTDLVTPTLPPQPAESPHPIFVVGMPRSGTTLAESILAAHSGVYGAGELPTLLDITEALIAVARSRGIEAAREMLRKESAAWRQRYLTALPIAVKTGSVVDKQPLNYRAIGLIRVLFPDSPIVYTQRSPMDVGLSIYRHKFSKNWPCGNSLTHIGHFYTVHVRIMELWFRLYPQAIKTLDHAALVHDPQREIKDLLAFAKLSPEAACFSPHTTKRPIATFSSAQVRQPITDSFSGKSRRFTSQLAPLEEALTNVKGDATRA